MGVNKIINLELLDRFLAKLKTYISGVVENKQDLLVNGENIKTINGKSLLGNGDIDTGVVTYVNEIIKGERYNPSTGEIEASTEDHYRTSKFATLGKFNATFRWDVVSGGTVWVHGWDTHGNYTGSLSQEVEVGSTELNWSLQPSYGDAYYAFDFITQDEDASTIYVDVTYSYAQQDKIPTKVSQLTNDSNYATTSAVANKADKYKTQNVTSVVSSASGSYSFQPNTYYVIDQLSGITTFTFSFATPSDTSIVNEYYIQFTTPAAGVALSLPSSIKWLNGETPTIQGGKTYQLNVINNLAVIGVFG